MHKNAPDHGPHSGADYIDYSVEVLKKSGARITKPRLAVLACLSTSKQSLSPKELLAKLQTGSQKAGVDLATIYRILEAFYELGLVHRVGPEGSFMACVHLDCASEMHMVAYCSSCDKTQEVDLPAEFMALLRKHVQRSLHFRFGEHFFQMNGICIDCAPKRDAGKPRGDAK
jgi:Fe2+ or Zn2+ uptake regulation protein